MLLCCKPIGELQPREARIEATIGDQTVMRSAGHNLAAIKHKDVVCLFHCCQTVCDHKGGSPARQSLDSRLHSTLTFGIQRTCCFIQQQDLSLIHI